jgi:hypothetical protein
MRLLSHFICKQIKPEAFMLAKIDDFLEKQTRFGRHPSDRKHESAGKF